MRCLEFMKITEILRLKAMNLFTYRDIAQSIGCSKTTVGDILKRCKECGLTYEDACTMTQERINELVYPESFEPKQVKEEPDWDFIHARLQSSRKINLQYIWENDYRPVHCKCQAKFYIGKIILPRTERGSLLWMNVNEMPCLKQFRI